MRHVLWASCPAFAVQLCVSTDPQRPFTTATFGFLAGFGVAVVAGLYVLQNEYRTASSSVIASSALLDSHAQNVTKYLDRISAAEAKVDQLEKKLISRDLIDKTNDAARRMYSDMHEETLALRERMWRLGAYCC